MVAQNPRADPGSVYIFHSRPPRFLAKVEGNSFEIVDDIDNIVDYYENTERIEGLIKRMSDWYKSYNIHENGRNR